MTPPTIEMTPPRPDPGNIYCRGMSAILAHLGTEVSYERMMGLSGVAFILQVDTGGPYLPDRHLDAAWWPNDPWGFDLGLAVVSRAVGWELRKVPCDAKTYKPDPEAAYRRQFAGPIERSLQAGRPVLENGFIITGMDDQQPPLLGYGTRGKSTKYSQQTIRIEHYPWGIYLVGEKIPAVGAAESDLASLRHIAALFNERAQRAASRTRFSGRRAWAEWLGLLKRAMVEGDKSNCGGAWDNNMLIHLRYNRACAVPYLHEMAQRHAGKTAEHLEAAAALYRCALDELLKGEMPHPGPTQGGLPAYAGMVEHVSKLEIEAVARIEAAAADMEECQ